LLVYLTYRFRLKKKNLRHLNGMARSVNFVWNYCNEASHRSATYNSKWLTGFDLNKLTAGCASDLNLVSKTVNAVAENYASRRIAAKKLKLRWRTSKNLGWIPFKYIKIVGSSVTYHGVRFSFWNSRPLSGEVIGGSFNQDAKGNWFINIKCKRPKLTISHKSENAIAIDLGLKDLIVTSNGVKHDNPTVW
jgi:putative transposase